MTLEELFATVGAGTRAGYASTGANLSGSAAGERADIRAGDRETTEGTLESEAYAEKQAEKSKGWVGLRGRCGSRGFGVGFGGRRASCSVKFRAVRFRLYRSRSLQPNIILQVFSKSTRFAGF